MASISPSSQKKPIAKRTSDNAMDSSILSGLVTQEKEAAKSGIFEKELTMWESYGESHAECSIAKAEKSENDSSIAQAENSENSDFLSSQRNMKQAMSEVEKCERFDTSVSRSDKSRNEETKNLRSHFDNKSKKCSHSATVTSGQDVSHINEDPIKRSVDHEYDHNALQLFELRLDSLETQNCELQKLLEKTNKELVESKAALSEKEKLLVETKESLEVCSKSRVVWEQLVESKKAKVEELKENNHKLVEKMRELEKKVKEGQLKSEYLDKELLETKAALQEKSNKVIFTLENASRSSSEASKKIKSLQDQFFQRTVEVTKYKDKLQQLTGRDSEVTLHCKALQKEVNEKDGKLRLLAIELEEEKQKQRKSGLELDHVRQEQCQKHVEEKQKLANCEESLLTAQNGAEKLRSQLQTLEREKEMWSTKHTEEISILKNRISELDQKLKVNTNALEHVIVKPLDTRPLLSPGKDTSGQELHLAPQNVAAKRSKSQLHLQSENLGEHHFEAFVHSSAPSSLKKDNYSATADNQDVDTQEQEVNRYNAYESPHTSLTEVAGKVTVSLFHFSQL